MSALRGVVAGVLGLSLMEAVVTSTSGASNTGRLFDLAASFVNRLVDPSVPLIPDLAHTGK